jgi:hypothetical protein
VTRPRVAPFAQTFGTKIPSVPGEYLTRRSRRPSRGHVTYAPTGHVIQGEDPEGDTLAITDLADGGTGARVRTAGPAAARAAVGAARSAQRATRETTLVQRADWLDRTAGEWRPGRRGSRRPSACGRAAVPRS